MIGLHLFFLEMSKKCWPRYITSCPEGRNVIMNILPNFTWKFLLQNLLTGPKFFSMPALKKRHCKNFYKSSIGLQSGDLNGHNRTSLFVSSLNCHNGQHLRGHTTLRFSKNRFFWLHLFTYLYIRAYFKRLNM
jgi:hypothetical protein